MWTECLFLKQTFDVMDIKTHLIERPDRRSPYHAFEFTEYEVINLLLILRVQNGHVKLHSI